MKELSSDQSPLELMDFKINLQAVCKKWGITLADLARQSGVPHQTMHGWTVGRKAVNLEHLRRVADALAIDLYQLLYGAKDPHGNAGGFENILKGPLKITIESI